MKHLLNGVMIAAALAIAGPVWAQTGAPMGAPMSPSAAGAPSAGMPSAEPMAAAPRHRARPHRAVRRGAARSSAKSSADNVASQLNQQELSRVQTGGGAAAPMAPGPMSAPQEGPRPGRGR
jgi:hypothetical protein